MGKLKCDLCHSDVAIGKYYTPGGGDSVKGWWNVCKFDASMVSKQGYAVQLFKTKEPNFTNAQLVCEHQWDKHSMVLCEGKDGESDFDWMKCTLCGCFGKRPMLKECVIDLQPVRPISNY